MKYSIPIPPTEPPSRRDNPFATCWTQPGALAFRFGEKLSAEKFVAKLLAQNCYGAIIGPHGSGKSTLLESLKPVLVSAGLTIHAISLRDGQHVLPRDFFESWNIRGLAHFAESSEQNVPVPFSVGGFRIGSKPLVIIDGYEQLHWLQRWRLKRQCRRASAGLLVTSHRPVRVRTLIRLSPDREVVETLVTELCANVPTPITAADVAASHACYGSNVREILFDLYDRHEQRRRRSNALPAAT